MNVLRRKINVELILMEEQQEHDEMPHDKFVKIFNATIKTPLSAGTYNLLLKNIFDDEMKYLKYDKFNRFCDLFFVLPGKVYKDKNDSENMYMMMSSMKRKKASILCPSEDKRSLKEINISSLLERFW